MCWKSEIITDIDEGKVNTGEIDQQIKPGLYVEYTEINAGDLTLKNGIIEKVVGDQVYLDNGHQMHIAGVGLYLLYK